MSTSQTKSLLTFLQSKLQRQKTDILVKKCCYLVRIFSNI